MLKLQITNIARDLSEDDLKKMFEKFAPVSECTLVMDQATGKSKGFGFVLMANETHARKAADLLNGRMVNGVKIKVKVAA